MNPAVVSGLAAVLSSLFLVVSGRYATGNSPYLYPWVKTHG